MAFRKKTLRTMSPTARKVARLAGEIESAATRLKNMIPELQSLDLESKALKTATQLDTKAAKRELEMIKGVAAMRYKEIRNAEDINHTLEVITERAQQALDILG
jgi:conjugal transfer/entry exclusion protein